jgi:GMP synthase (glutamine-hydrolysing)
MITTITKVNRSVLREIREEMKIRKTGEVFLLFSLGSQFDHLIAQMLAFLGVFCLVADPRRIKAKDVKKLAPIGVILSGGPASVYEDAPPFDEKIFDLGIPVFGICLGFQLWAQHVGCIVAQADEREFGPHGFTSYSPGKLFAGCPGQMQVLESHGDRVESAVPGFKNLGFTDNALIAAGRYRHLWGVQFHPEVSDTICGPQIFENFCFGICGAKDKYPAEKVAERKIAELRNQIGKKKVLIALSGGSDSSVTAHLIEKAIDGRPGQVRGIYIKGLDRPDDEQYVHDYFGRRDWIDVRVIDATREFLKALKGKKGMRAKRLAMRKVYKAVLEREIRKFGASFIAQGTLYTDISESGGGYDTGARKAQIKIHHNWNLGFSVPEIIPLADQVKDTARNIGRIIGVPEVLLTRHPFPGPGLAVRIEGEVTRKKLRIARQIDGIWVEELREAKLYETVWQAGAVVTESVHACTKGDDAASGIVVRLWAVWSVNGFTARWARLPYDFLDRVSKRITNEVREVGDVDYRISGKPPTTIECG